MQRYQKLFQNLAAHNEGALIPFVVLADPDVTQSHAIITALIEGGADALELGIPFSDPLADGPTIQRAMLRTLQNGAKLSQCFELISSIRHEHSEIPIGLLVYANLVYRRGIEAFYQKCAESGVDSVLIADVPLEECHPFHAAAQAQQIADIYICPPDADEATLDRLAELSSGYVYLLSRAGVTGAEIAAGAVHKPAVQALRERQAAPLVQGFGISRPEQVRGALQAGVDGVISGSAVVQIIEDHLHEPAAMQEALRQYIQELKAATRRTS